jgi:hypothetical protein
MPKRIGREGRMLRNRQTSKKEAAITAALGWGVGGRSPLERRLLEFMDRFDIYLFLYDPAYRRQLNDILDRFTDEEFESFERTHSHRFTVN